MKMVREIFAKPIDRTIEEVIKVGQAFRGCGPSRPAQHLVGFFRVFPTGRSAQEIPHPKIGSALPRYFRSLQRSASRIQGRLFVAFRLAIYSLWLILGWGS
jgi:hypothetical protein